MTTGTCSRVSPRTSQFSFSLFYTFLEKCTEIGKSMSQYQHLNQAGIKFKSSRIVFENIIFHGSLTSSANLKKSSHINLHQFAQHQKSLCPSEKWFIDRIGIDLTILSFRHRSTNHFSLRYDKIFKYITNNDICACVYTYVIKIWIGVEIFELHYYIMKYYIMKQ